MRRAAFTFIELVFSIVIVGLVILSIPLIVRQSNANTMQSQNVIGYYNALTLMETIKNKPWDRSNVDDFEKSGEYYILQTGNVATDCKKDTSSNIWTKPGLGNADRRRMCDPLQRNAQDIKPDNALSSINDFHNYTQKISAKGNIFFNIDVAINYVNVNFGSGLNPGRITNATRPTDVKAITLTLNRSVGSTKEAIAKFTYYAANIGTDVPFAKDN